MARDTVSSSVQRVLVNAGATIDSVKAKKHVTIRWTYKGEKRLSLVSNTASDHRATMNAISDAKKQLREIDNA